MPWAWERALRRDSETWANFLDYLDKLESDAMQRLVFVTADQHDRAAGVVEGIRQVRATATAEEQEEHARATR